MVRFRLSAFADEADPSLKQQIEVLRRHGISLLEMRGVDGKNVSELSDAEAAEARRAKAAAAEAQQAESLSAEPENAEHITEE